MYRRPRGPSRSVHHYTDYVNAIKETSTSTSLIQENKPTLTPAKKIKPKQKISTEISSTSTSSIKKSKKSKKEYSPSKKKKRKLKRQKRRESKQKIEQKKLRQAEEPKPVQEITDQAPPISEPEIEEVEEIEEIPEWDDVNSWLQDLVNTLWEVKEELRKQWDWDIASDLALAAFRLEEVMQEPYEFKVRVADELAKDPYLGRMWDLLNFAEYLEVMMGADAIASSIISSIERAL